MPAKWWLSFVLAATLAAPAAALAAPVAGLARPPQRDYLTQTEADKIRDANSANERIKLFLDFAQDRLRRFKQELKMQGAGPRWADFLNDILNAFDSCVDEASGRIDDAISHGEDVRDGIKDAKKRVPEFLKELEQIKAQGIHLKLYQYTLDDTVDDLHYVLKDVDKAAKQLEMNPPKKKPHGGARR